MSASPSVAIAGSGSAGGCFTPAVIYSGEANNLARAGSDGGVFADACVVAGGDGTPVDRLEDGCFVLPVSAVLDYNGDPIVPVNGAVQLPTSGPPPAFGCGLRTNGDGDLEVASSSTWAALRDLANQAFDGSDANGSRIYCGPNGELRGVPEHTAVGVYGVDTLLATTIINVTTVYTSPASAPVVITNPSPSRRMVVEQTLRATVDLSAQAASGPQVALQRRVDGGAWTTIRLGVWPEPGTGAIRASLPIGESITTSIAAGDSTSIELRVQVTSTGSAPLSMIAASCGTTLLGVTR